MNRVVGWIDIAIGMVSIVVGFLGMLGLTIVYKNRPYR